MSELFSDPQYTDDMHQLMAIAVLCGRRGVETDLRPVYELWEKCYPDDALGRIGIGLIKMVEGEVDEGYRLIENAANTAQTRRDSAQSVLASVKRSMEQGAFSAAR